MIANTIAMRTDLPPENEPALFLAGHIAPAGVYHMFGRKREVRLDVEGILPASLDGRVAVYQRRGTTWAERRGYEENYEMTYSEIQGALNESFPAT